MRAEAGPSPGRDGPAPCPRRGSRPAMHLACAHGTASGPSRAFAGPGGRWGCSRRVGDGPGRESGPAWGEGAGPHIWSGLHIPHIRRGRRAVGERRKAKEGRRRVVGGRGTGSRRAVASEGPAGAAPAVRPARLTRLLVPQGRAAPALAPAAPLGRPLRPGPSRPGPSPGAEVRHRSRPPRNMPPVRRLRHAVPGGAAGVCAGPGRRADAVGGCQTEASGALAMT